MEDPYPTGKMSGLKSLGLCSLFVPDIDILQLPAKSKRGREEGDGTENVIHCRKLSQIVVTFYDEFYDDL